MKKMSEPEEAIPRLVACVQLPPSKPRVNGGPPVPNDVTQADIDKLNSDKGVEFKIMNAPNGWGPKSSGRNRASQPSFASLNEGLTFSGISASGFANSDYMKSRRIG